ncbi:MAG TPA: phosphatase PAP2 family protein [Anaerolineales bacterium]|nr:phosphatase PAP2 family protein [Anaerolineales bacterium]
MQALLALDARLSAQLRLAERPGLLRNLAILLAHSGDSWFWLLGLGIVWIFGTEAWRQRAQMLALGILITAVLVMVIKFTVRRRRPAGEWGGIYRQTDPHSFPSGHAARAMMLAVLASGLGPGWFAAVLLVWAPLVVLARVAMGVHYLSDVVAGGLFGILTGFAVLRFI